MVEDGIADKELGKNQIKIFPVPFDFKDLKENINMYDINDNKTKLTSDIINTSVSKKEDIVAPSNRS